MTFRWPFVSRATHEDVKHELWLEQQRHAAERERTAALTQTIVELKTTGAVYVKDAQERIAHRLAARPSDPVARAIDDLEIAKGDPAMRRHLSRYADEMRRAGKSEDDIIEAVTSWTDPDRDPDDEPEFIG